MTLRLDASTYAAAEKLLHGSRLRLVPGSKVRPQWLDGGERFWYRVDEPEGQRFVIVDPARRSREPLEGPPPGAAATVDPLLVQSPDGSRAVFPRGHDLWVRDRASGTEQPLTSDGSADGSYGTMPDLLSYGVLMRRFGLPRFPPLVLWSPDSRRVLTQRLDQRGVEQAYLIESTPAGGGRPVLHAYRYPLPGDGTVPLGTYVVLDVDDRTVVEAKDNRTIVTMLPPLMLGRAWWASDGSAVYFLDQPRDLRTLWLKRLDPATGEVRTLVEERGETRVEPAQSIAQKPIVRVFSGGNEVLWFSQRDGWGHLYLYDARSGELRRRVTSGNYVVYEILHVDEDQRLVWFLASGLVSDDPYRRQICRVGLDGSGFTRIGHDDLDHVIKVSPNGAYFVDSASTTADAPLSTVRDWDGEVLVELEQADASRLVELGWSPPERFEVKAADGTTDIYGLLYRPHGFDPNGRYPVVDHPYPGPQVTRVHPSFDQSPEYDDAEAVAALGFVVLAIDGRGTPHRSKAFHDVSYGRLGDAGSIDDHVAAIRQLAETRPWMDLDRVGIFGLSAGGFATVRAMCTFPDVFKVGVAEAGNHDQRMYLAGWGEMYDGPFEPETYARSANVEIADRLVGKLLLVHGEMDDNVHPTQTLRLVDRLIRANRDFELLIVPGAEHFFVGYEFYVRRRKWDFLVRNLLGAEPPAGYRLAAAPMDFAAFAEIMGD